jgi:hypothetical protein
MMSLIINQLSVARFTGFVFNIYRQPSPDLSGLGYFHSSAGADENLNQAPKGAR